MQSAKPSGPGIAGERQTGQGGITPGAWPRVGAVLPVLAIVNGSGNVCAEGLAALVWAHGNTISNETARHTFQPGLSRRYTDRRAAAYESGQGELMRSIKRRCPCAIAACCYRSPGQQQDEADVFTPSLGSASKAPGPAVNAYANAHRQFSGLPRPASCAILVIACSCVWKLESGDVRLMRRWSVVRAWREKPMKPAWLTS